MHQKIRHIYVEATSITVLLPHHKRSSGRHKCSSGRSVSEAALHFGNLHVYEPSSLWMKPSTSLEQTFQFSEEAFQFVALLHCQHMYVRNNVLNVGIIFF